MFLRKIRRNKDGKLHVYWALVESVRVGTKVRQRVVCYLGDLSDEQAQSHENAVRRVDNQASRHGDLFAVSKAHECVEIYPGLIRVERTRDFGNAWMGLQLWRLLGFDSFFSQAVTPGRPKVRWATMIAFEAISRFCESGSELAMAESFTDRSALADLLAVHPASVNPSRLYRTLDRAVQVRQKLAAHLKDKYHDLFGLKYDLLLYDLTSTYFEGEAALNPDACHGYSRDGRSDAKQIVLALVVTPEGLPLCFETFPGNRHDSTTLEHIVNKIESAFGKAERVWVMDRGIASEKNLQWLRARGALYLVGTPKSQLRNFEKQIAQTDWRKVRDGLEVKFAVAPDGSREVYVLCRSQSRRLKELAMLKRFAQRIEQGLSRIQIACRRKRNPLNDKIKLGKRIGALLSSNSRASRQFEIHVEENTGRLDLTWKTISTDQTSWAEISAGHYGLRSNLDCELSPQQMWHAYIQLTQIEGAFRCLKTDLGMRPLYHQIARRVEAHIFICFLALCMRRTLGLYLEQTGLGNSPGKVLSELQAWRSMDLVMPTSSGRRRIVADPEPGLKILLQKMGLRPPKTIAEPANVVETNRRILMQPQQIQHSLS